MRLLPCLLSCACVACSGVTIASDAGDDSGEDAGPVERSWAVELDEFEPAGAGPGTDGSVFVSSSSAVGLLNLTRFGAAYIQNLGQGAYLIEGAERVIKSLLGRVGLVLITNGLKDVQRSRLARSTIGDCFSAVVISEEVGAAKPDPRIFQAAFERMGNPKKEEVLIVGDSLSSDIKGGNAYGIDTCWFNPARLVCDQDVEIQYEIRHLDELWDILGVGEY